MKKIIALLLIALVIMVSGCTAINNLTGDSGGNTNASSPLGSAFQGAGNNPSVGSPPSMPELPG